MDHIGWIKLHRIIIDKPIWHRSTPEQKSVLITILLMANHKSNEWEWQGEKFTVKPGQFVTSLDRISEKAGKGVSVQNVRSSLKKFEEKYQFLTNKSTKSGRLITICNWDDYQSNEEDTNKDTNNEPTKSQQRNNKEVTPNKNDKNDKNDKKNTPESIYFIQNPTQKKVKEWKDKYGYPEEFEELFNLSDKRQEKLAALTQWVSLTEAERERVKAHWPEYTKLTTGGFQKYFRTYLSNQGWEDNLEDLKQSQNQQTELHDATLGI